MKLGKNIGRITDYGMTKTRAGKGQIFVRVALDDGDEQTWYGMPFKNDGELNEICIQQLVYCGLDLERFSINDVNKGPSCGALDTDSPIDVYCANKTQGDGSLQMRINSLGPIGPMVLAEDEVDTLFTDEQRAKLKAAANKFKPKKRAAVKKEAEDEDVPF